MKVARLLSLFTGFFILTFHFCLIGLSLMPDNPIKHQFKYELKSYTEPFFSQSWNLFSPTPINTNMTVLLQFKLYQGESYDTTIWVDIYQPLIEEKRKNFWSPVQRLSKFMTSCMQNVLETNREFAEIIKGDSVLLSDSTKAKAAYQKQLSYSFGHTSLIQYSNYVLKKMLDEPKLHKIDSAFVRYEIFNSRFPRFSKRDADYFDLKNYKFNKITSQYFKI